MRNHGFTLIEIIVSVSLLLLLSGIFIANYNGFSISQTLKKSSSDLVSNLQSVRSKASSGVKPTGCGPSDTLVGYRVVFSNIDISNAKYTAQARCIISGTETGVGSINTYLLPSGVIFSPVPGSITFYVLDRGVSANRTITLVGSGKTTNVSVYTSGIVSE